MSRRRRGPTRKAKARERRAAERHGLDVEGYRHHLRDKAAAADRRSRQDYLARKHRRPVEADR